MTTRLFDIEQDQAMINAGGFWCSSCLSGRPSVEASPDSRYCQDCYDALFKEAKSVGWRVGNWRPKKLKRETHRSVADAFSVNDRPLAEDNGCDTVLHEDSDGSPPVTDRINDKIRELAGKGKSCRTIEKELTTMGITMSYRTIHRRIRRERMRH